jgi:hypothetical protein
MAHFYGGGGFPQDGMVLLITFVGLYDPAEAGIRTPLESRDL